MTTIHFPNLSSAYLFINELSGQISDGKYENSRPYDHWRWITNVDIIVDGECWCHGSRWYGSSYNKRYNLREWPGYINKSINGDTNYDWAWRIYYGARFANIFENNSNVIKTAIAGDFNKFGYAAQHAIEIIGSNINTNPNYTYDEFLIDYNKSSRAPLPDLFTEDAFNSYKNSNYSLKDLKKDLQLMANAVNTDVIRVAA